MKISKSFPLLLILSFSLQVICQTDSSNAINDVCMYKRFPIYAGGDADETIQCMLYDEESGHIITAGKTNSNNFAPAQNDHGYIFALDLDGDWMWGNFFYNVSYAVSSITGCKMSSNNNYLTIFGIANSVPVIMLLNKADGSIDTFLTVSYVKTYSSTPSFVTASGFHFEEEDPLDGKSYFYLSFTMNKVL